MSHRERSAPRTRILLFVTCLYFAWTLAPSLLLLRLSLSEAAPDHAATGITLRWYAAVLGSPSLRSPLEQSLKLALLTTTIALPLAVGLALGVARARGPLSRLARLLAAGPLVVPETIMASGFFMVFVHLFTFVRLSSSAQLLGHVTLVLPFATLILLSSLLATGSEYEEAAWDLGASRLAAIRFVVLPLVTPALIASIAVTFALSLNDLVMSDFLCIDIACRTVPVALYGASEPTPASSATAVMLVGLSVPPVVVAWAALQWWSSIRTPSPGPKR